MPVHQHGIGTCACSDQRHITVYNMHSYTQLKGDSHAAMHQLLIAGYW